MITVKVSNTVLVKGLGAKNAEAIVEKFSIPNVQYAIALKRHISTRFIPKYIRYANYVPEFDELMVPRGLMGYVGKVQDALPNVEWAPWEFDLAEFPAGLPNTPSTIELRDYQNTIVNEVFAKLRGGAELGGLIEMGTGTGKTIVALKLVEMLRLRATILVPNNVLLNQWADEARHWLKIEPGILGGGERSLGPITIATWQSAGKKGKINDQLRAETSLLIVDECNGVTSPIRRKTLSLFKPKHILGLTATPDRTDGQTMGVHYLLGHTLARHQATELKPVVDIIYSKENLPLHHDYHKMVDAMVENESRNKLIVGLVLGEILQKKKILVLTKRIKHYENIRALFGSVGGLHFIDSSDSARHDLLAAFKSGEASYNAIFGTTSLLAVGTDIPSLDTIIVACDVKSGVLTTQSVGRILRLFEGKPTPKIIDIADTMNPIFRNQFWARRRLYEEKGWLEPFKPSLTKKPPKSIW